MPTLINWNNFNREICITDEGEVLTYGRIYKDVMALAQLLPRRQLIFFGGRNDVTTLTVYLACFEAESVPLLLDPNISTFHLFELMKVYEPKYIFFPTAYIGIPNTFEIKEIFGNYTLFWNPNEEGPKLNSDLALLLTTSGSTGSPKLVRLSNNNLHSNARSIIKYLGINQNDRAITSLPFNYSYGMSVINSHLLAGASIVLTNRSFVDPVFWKQMKSHSVTSLSGVPYSYEMLLKFRFERMDLPSLRTMTQAGGKLSVENIVRISNICKIKNIRFFTMYGQTEASPRISYLEPDRLEEKAGSIGNAVPGGRLWIEDEKGQIVDAINQVGELIYSGPNVALGYAQCKQDLNLGDEWSGLLRTGDFASKDKDGFFFIEGRKSRFLKLSGVRVSMDMLEAWFYQKGIAVAAHGYDDHLHLTVESSEPEHIASEIKMFASEMHIHRSTLQFSIVSALPRLSSGKVDYSALYVKNKINFLRE